MHENACVTQKWQLARLGMDEPLAGIIDSLAVLGLIGFIEAEFSIEISPSDVTDENFATIGTIADLVERLTKFKN